MIDGKVVKTFRRLAGIRQDELADAIGRSIGFVHNLEANQVTLTRAEERKVRAFLGIPEHQPAPAEGKEGVRHGS